MKPDKTAILNVNLDAEKTLTMSTLNQAENALIRLAQTGADLLIIQHSGPIEVEINKTLKTIATPPHNPRRFCLIDGNFSWKILNQKKIDIKDCILLGIFAAIGFLSKYLFVYLLVAIDFLFLYIIFIKKEKKFDYKYLISFVVFLVLLVPHLIWLIDNDYITITYGLGRAGLENSNFFQDIKGNIL